MVNEGIFSPYLGCTADKGEREARLGVGHSPSVSLVPVFPASTASGLLTRDAHTH